MNKFALKKCDIIRRSDDLRRIVRSGNRLKQRGIILYYTPSDRWRICISIKKQYGNAVARNKLRRRMKEVFRQNVPAGNAQFNLVWVIAKVPWLYDTSMAELLKTMIEMMNTVILRSGHHNMLNNE